MELVCGICVRASRQKQNKFYGRFGCTSYQHSNNLQNIFHYTVTQL